MVRTENWYDHQKDAAELPIGCVEIGTSAAATGCWRFGMGVVFGESPRPSKTQGRATQLVIEGRPSRSACRAVAGFQCVGVFGKPVVDLGQVTLVVSRQT